MHALVHAVSFPIYIGFLTLQDPHDELVHQNVLMVRGSLEDTAKQFDLDLDTTRSLLNKTRQMLFDVRKKRPPPHLDNKMLTAWNGE